MFLSLEGNNKTEKSYLQSLNEDCGDKFALNFTSGRETDLRNMWRALQDLMQDSFYYLTHLKSKTPDAIRNSIRQIEQIDGDSPSDSFIPENPGTEVYVIVQAIHA